MQVLIPGALRSYTRASQVEAVGQTQAGITAVKLKEQRGQRLAYGLDL